MIDERLQAFVFEVMRITAEECDIPEADIFKCVKKPPTRIIIPRYIGWKIIYERTVHFRDRNGNRIISYNKIGGLYGGFDHATVLYGIRQCTVAIGEEKNIPPDMRWKVPYDNSLEKLQPAIKEISLSGTVFFSYSPDGAIRARKFLHDIGEFWACSGSNSEIVARANSMLERYKK